MPSVPQHILNWLYSVLTSEYHHVNTVYNDVALALKQFSRLAPRTDVYTFETGQSALLLNIKGTIPIVFRGSTYWFPISIWLPHRYPEEAPMAYVTPTTTMQIRPGQYVDLQGRIYHPFLANWSHHRNPEGSLTQLLSVLLDIFSKEPPVVARQDPGNAPAGKLAVESSARRQPSPKQSPSLRHESVNSVSSAEAGNSTASIPALPPKPTKYNQNSSKGTDKFSDGVGSIHRVSGLPANSPPPRLPPPPQNLTRQRQQYTQTQMQTSMGQAGVAQPTPPPLPPHKPSLYRKQEDLQEVQQYATGQNEPPPLPPLPRKPNSAVEHYTPSSFTHTPVPLPPNHHTLPQQHQALQPGYPTSQIVHSASYVQPGEVTSQNLPNLSQQTFQQSAPAPSLAPPSSQYLPSPPPPSDIMDAPIPIEAHVGDNLPPLPLPPDKARLLQRISQALYAERSQSHQQTSSTLAGLTAQKSAMITAATALQNELATLDQLSETLATNSSILHGTIEEAENRTNSLTTTPAPDIDNLLVAPTVVANQLYQLVAEERALADAVHMLPRAMDRGRMTSTIFTKTTRNIAREWFMKKALIGKIAQGMGLDTTTTMSSS